MAFFFKRKSAKEELDISDSIIMEPIIGTESELSKMDTHSVSDTSFSSASKPSSMQEDEHVQLRRQIVSLGKQPKAQQARRKKDMVCYHDHNLKFKTLLRMLLSENWRYSSVARVTALLSTATIRW